jgi:anti-anti-sigma factor
MSIDDRITVHRQFDSAHVVLSGDFDISEGNRLIELSTQLFTELTATVEVDMSQVTFFGSSAIAGLLQLRNEVDRHSGAELRISRCSDRVRRVLELSGLLDMFAFGPSRVLAELSEVA